MNGKSEGTIVPADRLRPFSIPSEERDGYLMSTQAKITDKISAKNILKFLSVFSFFNFITHIRYEYKQKNKHNFYIKGAMKMNDKKQALGEKFAEELGFPKAIMNGFNHIELFGNREAIVNDCAGILEYSDGRIKLNMGRNTILFCGSDLCMKEYGSSRAIISGNIITVEFG